MQTDVAQPFMRQKLRTRNIRNTRIFSSSARRGITVTPLKGVLLTLLCVGIPTVSLGAVCLSLAKNNLKLNEENQELDKIASEVKAEVDSLGEEIEDLREWAGAESESAAQSLSRSNADRVSQEDLPPRGGPALAIDSLELLKSVRQQVPTLDRTLDSQIKPAVEEAIAKEAAYPSGIPVLGKVDISSEYGVRSNPFGGGGYEMHEGIDFVGSVGAEIVATGDGVVTLSGHNGGYGIVVTIDHGNGYESLYAHMSKADVEIGQSIRRGEVIGYIGSTGRSSGPHLHYSLYKDEQPINPRQLLKLAD
ncbi:M23 family metallopeptidase [cf. Phormidesmis sp. LEGE 11477]|uniref:M23 family metallopeptidase n=1 Tax=cf. Phormidesmis sp. LEGE 11477 TaxID=1828680 RepID=UPI00188166EE|nr:M23 family metallopeptidase [cf. Phormidesmis sp. LEGE 11477]